MAERAAFWVDHVLPEVGIQCFGSALNLNVHAHGLLLDGVYVEEDGELRFVRLPPPTTGDVEELVVTVAMRIHTVAESTEAHGFR